METITHSAQQTKELAHQLAHRLKGGEILALYGELGSGKTTFTQGLAAALGIKQRVVSPTFVIYKRYRFQISNFKFQILNHLDCYRLTGPGDLTGIDLDDIFDDQTAVTIIEWPERIEELLPAKTVKIKFEAIQTCHSGRLDPETSNCRKISFLDPSSGTGMTI